MFLTRVSGVWLGERDGYWLDLDARQLFLKSVFISCDFVVGLEATVVMPIVNVGHADFLHNSPGSEVIHVCRGYDLGKFQSVESIV